MNSDELQAERRGRSLGALTFVVLVSIPTIVWASQVIRQAFATPAESSVACEAGLIALIEGIEKARASATPAADEAEAILAFRANLGSSWEDHREVRAACKGQPHRLVQFGKIERLRYAEEHAVRYQTRGLSADRNAVEQIRRELAPSAAQ